MYIYYIMAVIVIMASYGRCNKLVIGGATGPQALTFPNHNE